MRKLTYTALAAIMLAGCSSIDCPLNNRVYTTYKFEGGAPAVPGTLTVSTPRAQAEDGDSVLVNLLSEADSVSLPMSYTAPEDSLFFRFENEGQEPVTDTVVVAKKDVPHFESVDCNPAFFHTITDVKHTGYAIDKIEITNNTVTYNAAKAHFLVYFKGNNN